MQDLAIEDEVAAQDGKKDRKKAAIRSSQNCSNMPQNNSQIAKKHKKLTEAHSMGPGSHLKVASNVIGGTSAAIPYRVSRVAQPTQHKLQFQAVAEKKRGSLEDEDEDDTWI